MSTTRRVPRWAVIAAAAGVALLTVAALASLVATALMTSGADSRAQWRDDRAAAVALEHADINGAGACRKLNLQIVGASTWQQVVAYSRVATTPAIRAAGDERELYDACTAAGAEMSSWPADWPPA